MSQQDACSLLTTAQVNAALGTTLNVDQSGAPTHCGWFPPGPPSMGRKAVRLSFVTPQQFATDKNPPAEYGAKSTPVAGLGDDAFVVRFAGGDPTLDVKKGNSIFQVQVTGFPPDQEQQLEQTLAKQVLAKL